MNKNTAFILFTVGFLLAFGGVGGIETSESDLNMILATLISGVGLLTMYAGTLIMKATEDL